MDLPLLLMHRLLRVHSLNSLRKPAAVAGALIQQRTRQARNLLADGALRGDGESHRTGGERPRAGGEKLRVGGEKLRAGGVTRRADGGQTTAQPLLPAKVSSIGTRLLRPADTRGAAATSNNSWGNTGTNDSGRGENTWGNAGADKGNSGRTGADNASWGNTDTRNSGWGSTGADGGWGNTGKDDSGWLSNSGWGTTGASGWGSTSTPGWDASASQPTEPPKPTRAKETSAFSFAPPPPPPKDGTRSRTASTSGASSVIIAVRAFVSNSFIAETDVSGNRRRLPRLAMQPALARQVTMKQVHRLLDHLQCCWSRRRRLGGRHTLLRIPCSNRVTNCSILKTSLSLSLSQSTASRGKYSQSMLPLVMQRALLSCCKGHLQGGALPTGTLGGERVAGQGEANGAVTAVPEDRRRCTQRAGRHARDIQEAGARGGAAPR